MLKRIHNERVRMKKEVREARARLQRLEKQLEYLEDKEEELVVTEWRNIHELEEQEKREVPATPSDPALLFDVSSELFADPPNLDWPSLCFGEIAGASSGSSQGAG